MTWAVAGIAYVLLCLWVGERLKSSGLEADNARLRQELKDETKVGDTLLAILVKDAQ